MYPEIKFLEPFLPRAIQKEFFLWTDDTCRQIEDALTIGCPLAVVGQRTDRRMLLLKIIARWLENQDQLVYETKLVISTMSEFMSALLTSVSEQLELEGFANIKDDFYNHAIDPATHSVEEYLQVIQELLEENNRNLFVFIESIEQLFMNLKRHEAYYLNNLVERCTKGVNFRIHFTYALDEESVFWKDSEEGVPLRIYHVVRMSGNDEEAARGFYPRTHLRLP